MTCPVCPSALTDFIKAWIGEDQIAQWLLSHLGGALAEATAPLLCCPVTLLLSHCEGATKGEDLNSLFCSELVAHLYQFGKVIPPRPGALEYEQHNKSKAASEPKKYGRDANAYSPKDFASQSNSSLTLASGMVLSHEKEIRYKYRNDAYRKGHADSKGVVNSTTHDANETCDTLSGASPLDAGQMGAQAGDKIGDTLKRQKLELHQKKVRNLQVRTHSFHFCAPGGLLIETLFSKAMVDAAAGKLADPQQIEILKAKLATAKKQWEAEQAEIKNSL